MKALSALFLLLSSADFRIASGAGIRAGPGVEDETPRERSNRDLAEADERPTDSDVITENHNLVVKKIAKEYDLSLEDAKEVYGVRRDFGLLVDDLFEDVNFLQSEIPTELDGPFVLKFKNGEVPEKGQDGIKKFREENENTKLEIVHSSLSLEEAEDRGERILAKLESKDHSQVAFFIDGDDLEVWATKPRRERSLGAVEGEDVGKVSSSRAAEILDLDRDDRDLEGLELHLSAHDDEDPVDLDRDDRDLEGLELRPSAHDDEDPAIHRGEDDAGWPQERPGARYLPPTRHKVSGGTRLGAGLTGGDKGKCTSGFTVQHKITKKCGVASAGHCDGYKFMSSSSNEDSRKYVLYTPEDGDKPNPSFTGKGEYIWYSVSSTVPMSNNIIIQYNTQHEKRKQVTKIAKSISVDDDICLYSRILRKSECAKVKKISATVTANGHTYKKVAVMEHDEDISREGDSGGPWYRETGKNEAIAYGIHGGDVEKKHCSKGKSCFWYSKIKYIDNKLDVEVITSGDVNCAPNP